MKEKGYRSILGCASLALLLATGCRTSPPAPPALPVPKEVPIIDIHTHNFNARDIPVRNIALGRRDALPPWSWLATDDMSKLVAAAIVAETHDDKPASRLKQEGQAPDQNMVEAAKEMSATDRAAQKSPSRAQHSAVQKALQQDKGVPHRRIGFKERLVLRAIASVISRRGRGIHIKSGNEILSQVGGFLSDVTLSHEELAQRYFEENSPDVQLRIVHMMDMGPTYGQEANEGELRPFEEQVAQMEQMQKDPKWRMAYFVAYNPFRDNAKPGEALGLVQRAVQEQGAYGVKLYPPAGYRPAENKIPHRPTARWTRYPGQEWDARYRSNGKRIAPADLDARLFELLRWCVLNDLPVFVHSGHGEFQARSGYGQDMPNPRWWKDFLDRHIKDFPEFANLRLCFGHAGGGESFFHARQFRSWSKTVAELCRRYPNIYCEVGCLDQILEQKNRPAFIRSMTELCRLPTDEEHPFNFGSKIMYGSDWYMPVIGGVARGEFLSAYQQVFLQPDLRPWFENFFCKNALAFLDAEKRIKDPKLGATTKGQLEALVQRGLALQTDKNAEIK